MLRHGHCGSTFAGFPEDYDRRTRDLIRHRGEDQMLLRREPVPGGFAVVDLETTGLYPRSDRVVEVAVIHLSTEGQITDEFSTLINPRRDVGPTRIHGIKAADVLHAPAFADAAATVWQLLTGRVLVAHNVPFDARFLDAEFSRCGVRLPPPPVMCTMQLASSYLSDLPGRSLPACCAAARSTMPNWHSALDDARAAARLLAPSYAAFRPLTRNKQSRLAAAQRPPLAGLVDRLPRGATTELDAYLAVLDRVLEDRIITADEVAELTALAADLGLTIDSAIRAHREYLMHIAAAAWRDRKITDLEHADLLDVARLLGVPADDALVILSQAQDIEPPSARRWRTGLQPGAGIVLTGDMATGKDELKALAVQAGLRVIGSVSGKTALLVAADPWSQSGKAKAARHLGVRIVTEQVFLYYLEQILAERPRR